MRAISLVLCTASALLLGCRGPVITNNGQTVYARNWNEAVQSLSGRAQYDLNCQPDQITYKLIARQGRIPVQMQAEGCGGRALYGRSVRASHAWSRLDTAAPPPGSSVNVQINNTIQN